eukprot:TRINITY_DN823_c0_g1_i5.p1 TRINITY_DN823_c0_g1~~TRINITY_DN823_c0_g1_i5.p1  ORF type:complete len:133 (+),score=29.12 TRINITY_DN823_c0_g1_i5:129-527(+)
MASFLRAMSLIIMVAGAMGDNEVTSQLRGADGDGKSEIQTPNTEAEASASEEAAATDFDFDFLSTLPANGTNDTDTLSLAATGKVTLNWCIRTCKKCLSCRFCLKSPNIRSCRTGVCGFCRRSCIPCKKYAR